MSMLAWGTSAFLIGLLAWGVIPWNVAAVLPPEYKQKIGDHYGSLAFASMRRAVVVATETGGLHLEPVSRDPPKGLKVEMNDETMHFKDPLKVMHRAYKKPFGLASESLGVVTSPLVAELGEEHHEHKTQSEHVVEAEDATMFNTFFELSRQERLVDLLRSVHIIPGSAEPTTVDTGEEYAKKSQQGFGSSVSAGEVIAVLGGFALGMLGMWFILSYGGTIANSTGGSTPDPQPIYIALEVLA